MSLLRRRMMMMAMKERSEENMINDKAFLGIYTLEQDITNDITLNSVLADFIGSGEIWIKKDIDGVMSSELLGIVFAQEGGTANYPFWIRRSSNGNIRCQNTNKTDYYMIAPAGTQFYRFNGYGGL